MPCWAGHCGTERGPRDGETRGDRSLLTCTQAPSVIWGKDVGTGGGASLGSRGPSGSIQDEPLSRGQQQPLYPCSIPDLHVQVLQTRGVAL